MKIIDKIEEPVIDIDYWVMGQDFTDKLHIKNIKVVNVSGKRATVKMSHYNFDYKPVTIELVFERGNWYINNFIDDKHNYNLKEIIKESIKEHGKSL